jgi:calcineurin-like phosphoesterase family protein
MNEFNKLFQHDHNKIWFIADPHFGHKRIINLCERPHKDLAEMEADIVEKWNRVVGLRDTVFALGDWIWLRDMKAERYFPYVDLFKKLNGFITFVIGNHDSYEVLQALVADCYTPENGHTFNSNIYNMHQIAVRDEDAFNGWQNIVLNHYPMRSWDGAHRGSWHLYGHVHYQPVFSSKDHLYGYTMDVGVDSNNFFPYSYSQVKKVFATYGQHGSLLGSNQTVWLPGQPSQAHLPDAPVIHPNG